MLSGVSRIVAVYPPCFLVSLERRGVPALFSGLFKVFYCVFPLSSGVSRMWRCVRLVFLCPECFMVCPECRGVAALFSGVSRAFCGVSRMSRCVLLVF